MQSHQHHHSLADQTYSRHDREEQDHFENVCDSFRQYATFAMCHWKNQQQRLEALPESEKRLLPSGLRSDSEQFKIRSSYFRDAAIRNQFCLDCILQHAGKPHSQQQATTSRLVADGQVSKVSSVLKSLARDWSEEGKAERDMSYAPILKALQEFVPIENNAARICVPGAGVGRLALELVSRGYAVQGNEFSLHMLMASDFILNGQSRQMAISPWLLESRNVHSPNDPVRKVMIPDVNPCEILSGDNADADFSMAAGDFASIYADSSQHGAWDTVVCCFFLDACPSIIQCIQIIRNMLKDGGILINFGPLLYHWSGPLMRPDDETKEAYQARFSHLDKRYMSSIDYCWQDIREILINAGFEFEEERVGIQSHYTADVSSMMNMSYRCVHFVARKKTTEPKTKDNESTKNVITAEKRSYEEPETKDLEASAKVDNVRKMSVELETQDMELTVKVVTAGELSVEPKTNDMDCTEKVVTPS